MVFGACYVLTHLSPRRQYLENSLQRWTFVWISPCESLAGLFGPLVSIRQLTRGTSGYFTYLWLHGQARQQRPRHVAEGLQVQIVVILIAPGLEVKVFLVQAPGALPLQRGRGAFTGRDRVVEAALLNDTPLLAVVARPFSVALRR